MYLKTWGIGISSLDVCFGEMLHTTLGSPWCLLEKMTQIMKLITQTHVYNVRNTLHIHLPHSLSWVTRIVKTKLFNLSSSWYPRQSLSRQATTSHHEKNCLSTTRAQELSIFTPFYEFSRCAWLTSFKIYPLFIMFEHIQEITWKCYEISTKRSCSDSDMLPCYIREWVDSASLHLVHLTMFYYIESAVYVTI